MSEAYLCPVLSGPQLDDNGNPLSGGLIWTYDAGTTTPAATYTADDGLIAKTNPIVLSARGETSSIWLKAGKPYKLILETAPAAGQTHGTVLQTWDDVTGVNDPAYLSGTPTWIQYADAPTRLTDTSFEVTGDARDTFQIARRLKCIVGASTLYALVTNAVYGTGATTVTVEMDSGALTADFSAVWYAWVETDPVSVGRASTADSLFGVVLTGVVLAYAGATAPDGFLLCDGSAVSRATYVDLYAIIGATYGSGDGSSTFNIPDLRGYFIRGLNTSGSGYDPTRALGSPQTSANIAHTHTVNDPQHTHTLNDPQHTHSYNETSYTTVAGTGSSANVGYQEETATSGAAATGITINGAATGITLSESGGTESRPVNIAMNYIIKY